jgi:hypothetical protein
MHSRHETITADACTAPRIAQALCEATKKDANRTDASQCYLYGFKRQAPFSYVDLTGRCWLLRAAGACKPEDFGIELYTRLQTRSNMPLASRSTD